MVYIWAGASSFAYVGPSEMVCKVYASFLDYPNMECRTLERGRTELKPLRVELVLSRFPQQLRTPHCLEEMRGSQ